jgi:hypothetical protein
MLKRDILNLRKGKLEKNVYMKYFYPYVINYKGEEIELKLVYNQDDKKIEGIIYEAEIHSVLSDVISNLSKYAIPVNVAEYRKLLPETRNVNVVFGKPSGNSSKGCFNPKTSVPIRWLYEMGINPDNREIDITFDGEKIIIKKKK